MTAAATSAGRQGTAPPAEGQDGLFSQSWFPVCLSSDVAPGEITGVDFLGGRAIVIRDANGEAKVLSAYCPHMGADLCVGEMVEGTIRCPFHHWRYDTGGQCVATGNGDPVPPRARLFAFPTAEKYGCIFAFNGTEPLFELPEFERSTKKLIWKIGQWDRPMPVDPWVICCNTPDMQHIEVVHGITFTDGQPHDRVKWEPHSMTYRFAGTMRDGTEIDFAVGIYGTSIYWQEGEFAGRWFGFVAPMGLPKPGESRLFFAVAVEEDERDPEGVRTFLEAMYELEVGIATEDLPILERARFKPGALTRSDKSLGRFFRYLRAYPRAHPSVEHIS